MGKQKKTNQCNISKKKKKENFSEIKKKINKKGKGEKFKLISKKMQKTKGFLKKKMQALANIRRNKTSKLNLGISAGKTYSSNLTKKDN